MPKNQQKQLIKAKACKESSIEAWNLSHLSAMGKKLICEV